MLELNKEFPFIPIHKNMSERTWKDLERLPRIPVR